MAETQATVDDVAKAWEGLDQPAYAKVEYFSLKDGETASLRILDLAPISVFLTRILVNGKRYPVSVLKEDNERVKAAGHKIALRHAINVIDRRDGKVKLWEFGRDILGDVQATMKKWKKLPTQFDLSVTRRGQQLETRYSVTIDPNMEPLTEEELVLTKINLSEYYKPSKERLETLLKGEVPKKKEESDTESKDDEVNLVTGETNPLVGNDSDDIV